MLATMFELLCNLVRCRLLHTQASALIVGAISINLEYVAEGIRFKAPMLQDRDCQRLVADNVKRLSVDVH